MSQMLRSKLSESCQASERARVLTIGSARANLSRVVTPFLKVLARKTGLPCMTLLAGRPPETREGGYLTSSVHIGESLGSKLNFSHWDPKGYSDNVLGQFSLFLQSTSGELPAVGVDTALTRTIEVTRVTRESERMPRPNGPKDIRIILSDPYERERDDRAKELAAAQNAKRKKNKKGKQADKGSGSSGSQNVTSAATESAPTSGLLNEPTSSAGQPSDATTTSVRTGSAQRVRPKPKPRATGNAGEKLTENAPQEMRDRVSQLEQGEMRREIERLNTLSVDELVMECEQMIADPAALLSTAPAVTRALDPRADDISVLNRDPDRTLSLQPPQHSSDVFDHAGFSPANGPSFYDIAAHPGMFTMPEIPTDPLGPIPFAMPSPFHFDFDAATNPDNDTTLSPARSPLGTGHVLQCPVPSAQPDQARSVDPIAAPLAVAPPAASNPTPLLSPAPSPPSASGDVQGGDDGALSAPTLPARSGRRVLHFPPNTPDWLREHAERLAAEPVPADLQEAYDDMLQDWIYVEAAHGFLSLVRPSIVGCMLCLLIESSSASDSVRRVVLRMSRFGSRTPAKVASY